MRSSDVFPAPFAPSTTQRSSPCTVHSMRSSIDAPSSTRLTPAQRKTGVSFTVLLRSPVGRESLEGAPFLAASPASCQGRTMGPDDSVAQRVRPHDRFPCFDGVRALAALMVVLYHAVFFNTDFLTPGGAFLG